MFQPLSSQVMSLPLDILILTTTIDDISLPGEHEMHLLETTIEKITGLLRVGFGEAGAGIISANLANKDSNTAINPLLPGKTLVCGCVFIYTSVFIQTSHSSLKHLLDCHK